MMQIVPIDMEINSTSIKLFKVLKLRKIYWEFPGNPVVGTPCFHCRSTGSIPGLGTKIPHAKTKQNKTPNKINNIQNKTHLLQNAFSISATSRQVCR